jgi:hypothetical protein
VLIALPHLVDFQNSAIAAHVAEDDWAEGGEVRTRGVMRALICRACGYTELYAASPENIPVDEIEGASLITPKSPYRQT